MSVKDNGSGEAVDSTSYDEIPPVIGDWEWKEFGSFESKMDRLGGALGISFFAVLLLTAFAAYETFNVDPGTWFRADYRWILTSAAGLAASLGVLMALRKSGLSREGRTSSEFRKSMLIILFNCVALASSAAVFIWIVYNWFEGTSSPRPDILYLGSTVGIALVMASLGISGKGTFFDRIASVSLAAVSAGIFLIPLAVEMSSSTEQNLVTSLYVIAAVASIMGGLVTMRTSRIRYRPEEPARRHGVLMGISILIAGAIAFYTDTLSDPSEFLVGVRWLIPPLVAFIVSILILIDSRSVGIVRGENIAFLAGMVSMLCLAVPALDMFGVMELEAVAWIYPLSLASVPLCMFAAFSIGRDRAKVPFLSMILTSIPAVSFLLVWLLGTFDGRTSLDMAWGYLGLYSAAFVLVFVSGLGIDSAVAKGEFERLARFLRIAFVVSFLVMAVAAYLVGREDMADHSGYLHAVMWLLPLMLGIGASSVMTIATASPEKGRPMWPVPLVLSVVSLFLLVVLVLMGADGFLYDFAPQASTLDDSPVFMSYVPMVSFSSLVFGTFLISLAIGLARNCTWIDVLLTGLTGLGAGMAIYMSTLISIFDLAKPPVDTVPSVGSLLAAAALVFFSYHLLHTMYSNALVTREKISINLKHGAKISKQVMRNPMGAIGIGILVFFVAIAIIGPSLAPEKILDPSANGSFERLLPQSSEHWMGTDNKGFDIYSQLLYGARTSMIVGITAAMIASVLGAAIGLYSGYVGGWKDEAIMRLNDIVLSIPWLVLMIIIAAYLGEINLVGIILIIGLTGWSATARLVRAQVLSLRERQFVERAKAIGCSDGAIIRRHILPNSFPLVFANTILTVAVAILSEATLSFLRMRPNDVITWGAMLSYAFEASAFYIGLHWWIIAPGLCIVMVVLGFTLIGFALDEVLNPKLRKR